MQRAAGGDEGLRHRHPFELPRARWRARGRRAMASSIRPACWRTTLASATISSQEIGLRFCGMVEEEPRPVTNGSNTSPISVCIISMTSVAILASAAGDEAEEATRSRPRRRGPTCQGVDGTAEAELGHQRVVHGEALVAERGERAGRAGELADQHARLELRQPLAVTADHRRARRRPCSRR